MEERKQQLQKSEAKAYPATEQEKEGGAQEEDSTQETTAELEAKEAEVAKIFQQLDAQQRKMRTAEGNWKKRRTPSQEAARQDMHSRCNVPMQKGKDQVKSRGR